MRLGHIGGFAVLGLGLLAGPALAQEGAEGDPVQWATRFAERQLERQAERLGLDEAQKQQFLEIHREMEKKLEAARKAQEQAIQDLLTDEQKRKLKEDRKNPFAAFGDLGLGDLTKRIGELGKRLNGGNGTGLSWGGNRNERLAKALGLDDGQREKFDAIQKQYGADRRAAATGVDWTDWRNPEKIQEQADAMRKKQEELCERRDKQIRKLLTSEQQAKYEKHQQEQQEQGGVFVRSFGLGGDGEDGGGVVVEVLEEDNGEGGNPFGHLGRLFGGGNRDGDNGGDWRERLREMRRGASVRSIKKDLQLPDEEEAIVLPLVEEILKLQRKHEGWRRTQNRALRRVLRDGTDEGTSDRLATIRDREAAHVKQLAGLRGELRELVTLAQEAVLVGYGVLD